MPFTVYKVGREEEKVFIKDIIFFRSNLREMELYLINGISKKFYSSMKDVSAQLEQLNGQFFMTHKSYIVNYLLAEELRQVSHNNCSIKRAEKILKLIQSAGETGREYQESRDAITRSLVSDLEHYRVQLEGVEWAIDTMLTEFHGTLMTMPGIDVIIAENMLSEIGDISRFLSSDKLAKFPRMECQGISYSGSIIFEEWQKERINSRH